MAEPNQVNAFNTPDIAAMNAISTGAEIDLVNLMIAYYQSKRPSWTPNAANVEVMLFEAFAMALSGEVVAVNNVAYTIVQQLMAYEGVYADNGARAAARIRFEVTPSLNPVTIPSGTRLRLSLDDSVGEAVDLITEEPITIYPETSTGFASAVAEFVGGGANGTPAGTPLSIIDNLPLVETATLYTAVLGGRDPETEQQFAARAEAARSALATTVVRPENFQNFAVRDPAVGRAFVLDRYNPADPSVTATGHVTVVVMDDVGQPLTAAQMTTLLNDIQDRALASLAIHVIAPTYTTVNATVEIRVRSGYDPDVVSTAAEDAITTWLSPMTWDWSPQVTPNMLVGLLSNVPGVAEVVTVPAAIALGQPAPVPLPGAIIVNVVA